ncbi:MAG: radical SAM protein, partial [Proteobacteria bacterium]|nr:radical SAM protein [Pseudomonadota bacterium]
MATLLRELDPIDGIERIRFVTSHPKDMTKEILMAVGELPRVCENLHMPVQSGSDRILKKMRRQYTVAHYKELTEMAREIVPDIKIASDFIVGFPGETDSDFEDTVKLLRDVRCQNSFIFKYSPRTGTAASTELIDDVGEETKKSRNHILLELQKEISTEENRKMHGKSIEVLVEGASKSAADRLSGRTRQNHIVVFDLPEGDNQDSLSASLPGKLVDINIVDSTD